MQSKNNFLNVVVGLGKTGLSCVNYCIRKNWQVAVTDSRLNPPGLDELKKLNKNNKNIEITLGEISHELINKADRLIVSPGVSLAEPAIAKAIEKKIPVVGDIELFIQEINSPIIAITGSNAKSTVTSLVYEMAKNACIDAQIAGNIGIPVLDLLDNEKELYVLELSSFQLDTTYSLKAKAATILNISEDHMDRYENIEKYIQSKMRIYDGCKSAVINRSDSATLPKNKISKIISFGLDAPTENNYGLITENDIEYLARGSEKLIKASDINLSGRQNIENALSALALAELADITLSTSLNTLKTFRGLPHRCELVAENNSIRWYNDSKGTNPGASIAAIKGVATSGKKNVILLAGGLGKNACFDSMKEEVGKSVKCAILFGKDSQIIANSFKSKTNIIYVDSMDKAVLEAKTIAKPGDVVLLSPACASFDMFDNYEHRGDVFVKCVLDILKN